MLTSPRGASLGHYYTELLQKATKGATSGHSYEKRVKTASAITHCK